MSFGRPPSINVGFKVTAPDRGSFPLDHYGAWKFQVNILFRADNRYTQPGECKDKMQQYMACLKQNGSTSTPCRNLSKEYLDCRMNKGLMERDEWKNLGLSNVDNKSKPSESTNAGASASDDKSSTQCRA
ncbi:Cytochrome c oxidase assembly protein COX19 [Psilocybe cubensis]|uniref:Cytochrome c oxidase assembly protein COX19 n=1 Tax=Psilocybe cubensis TaxID=181762 RepID=A0ACB8HIB9_PSICU|nr:Cytochrome c oxidase assembly protein COX19 [Psilocybe cubensis]KAH9487070.1 Cytochrome c oxidase assembly protein COX19 [Psilocybe cubensis]